MSTRIQEVMTKNVVAIRMGTKVSEAFRIMTEKRIRHLPVIDEMDDVVGVISQRDLVAEPQFDDREIEIVMSAPIEFVHVSTPLRKAVFNMLEKKVSSLLVVDDEENVKGIITTDDMLWCLAHLLADEKTVEDQSASFAIRARETIGELATRLAQIGI